ncbi:metalloregulator ArsR/SmtB family transcription factor [Dyella sp. EPa41]|uniref:ArsR/SmtB family transcription factor n=1 Tax=Dyella sp. EPa41 TaxID=1561194 RepID=UPI001F37619E|nr:metalloregulator ArsR/SmtB family transcription factor [Dyella sp. EPa41]
MTRSVKVAATRRRKPAWDMASMQRHADEAVAVLKAMGSQNRLMLLCELLEGERSVNDLASSLGLSQSVVSQHLSLLRRDGLVAGRREGQTIYYVISDERVHALMARLFELFCTSD